VLSLTWPYFHAVAILHFFQHMSMAMMLETNIFSQLWHMRICSHDCQPFMIFLNSDFRGGIAICYWTRAFDIWSDTNYCIYVLLSVFLMNWGNLAYAMMTYFSTNSPIFFPALGKNVVIQDLCFCVVVLYWTTILLANSLILQPLISLDDSDTGLFLTCS
jgi:hypothetical protein